VDLEGTEAGEEILAGIMEDTEAGRDILLGIMEDTEAGRDILVGIMEDTEAGEDTMVDSMADFISASAQDFGLDITGATTRIIGGGRMEGGPMRPMRAGPMLDGPTIHRRQRRRRLRLANRSSNNPTTGTTARIPKATTHTLKAARAVGNR